MDLIPSFQVDHTKLVPGIYVSRIDTIGNEFATTFDIRMKTPNVEPAIHPNAMHSIEHVVATFLRNDPEWKDKVIYWGPMGCLTGFPAATATPERTTGKPSPTPAWGRPPPRAAPPLPCSRCLPSRSGDPRSTTGTAPHPRHDPIPDPRRPASPRPGRAPGAPPTFTTGSR